MALYAFDGTWNERKDAGEYDRNTNVVRFVDAYTGKKRLLKGVGTRYGGLGKFFGGAFGVGGKKRIRDASMELFKNYPDDPVIDIVGFSRGSALALHFANTVKKKGVRDPETKERLGEGTPQIRFLGLNDISFRWMLRKAIRVGLPIDNDIFDQLHPDPDAEIKPASKDVVKNKFRKLRKDERFHYTVTPRAGEAFNNPPDGAGKETEDDELEKLQL